MADQDHLEGRDIDAEFAAIVAGWHDVGHRPGSEDAPAPAPAAPEEEAAEGPAPGRTPVVSPGLFDLAPTAREVPPPGPVEASLDEGFEPDPVTLPAPEDLHFWGIVGGLVAGPLLILWFALFGTGHSRLWLWAGVGALALGATLLVLRQPVHRDEDDDGARL